MKRQISILLFALVASVASQVSALAPNAGIGNVSFDRFVAMLATCEHWNESNLAALGLEKLVSEVEVDEECGDFYYFVYGSNVKAKQTEGWNVELTPTAPHAFAIEVTLTTDNGTVLYFSDKADCDAFLAAARSSHSFELNGQSESIGLSLIEGVESRNGWFVVMIHGG